MSFHDGRRHRHCGFDGEPGSDVAGVWMRPTALLMAALLLAACVSTRTVPLSDSAASPLQRKSIVLARHPLPDFAMMTAGKAALGGLFGAIGGAAGGAAMVEEGRRIVANNHIEDPAPLLGKTLLDELVQAHGMTAVDTQGATVDSFKPEEIAKRYPEADYVLDVATVNWSAIYFPMDWSHYDVLYSTKLSLVDVHTGKNIAEAFCARRPEKTANPPTYEQLLADGAARLKSAITEKSQSCLAELRKKLQVS